MRFHVLFTLAIIALFGSFVKAPAQVNSVIGQITNSASESFAGGISGDGRLVVFESVGNFATENPRNADGNREIFLFDYAQRRIFQITDTTSLRNDPAVAFSSANTKVLITNLRPVISNDGRWIAFGSNATTSTPSAPNATNPGSFNADSFTNNSVNPLTSDGNTEMWLYQVPEIAPVNLSAGEELAVTDLSAGAFTRVSNSLPSRLPFPGSASNLPIIGDDNRDASISDNGNYIAFTSNRDLVTGGNASPNANDEIFTYARNLAAVKQVTQTPRGTIVSPIVNITPTISGNGLRVAFQSNADKPVAGIAESNADRNFEIFFVDLDATGAPFGLRKQITTTARVNPGDIVNILDFGRRMSRDGRYIAFDSYADLVGGGANQSSYATYLYDTSLTGNAFRQIGPRSDADAAATGGDVPRFVGFTDTNAVGTPDTLVLETRLNITSNGTVAATNDAGLNPNTARPAQIYSYPLNIPAASAFFTRLTTFPAPNSFTAATQPIPSNSQRRMTFNLALTEFGTGNSDLQSEAFYYVLPTFDSQSLGTFNFATGASRQTVSPSPVPTPTASPSPQTPSAVQGVSPGMLALLNYNSNNPITARTAVGSLSRRFTLPIELSGVTMTINGAAVGLKSVGQQQIEFVVPPGLPAATTGTSYSVVINNNGAVFTGSITIVPTRPDVFTLSPVAAANGRARVFNITNTVFRTEPFNVTTLRLRGGRRVPTVLRLFVTGVEGAPASATSIRVRDVNITPTTAAVLREPGVQSFDFTLPASLLGAGDVPVVVTVTVNGTAFQSRLDDTAPRFTIL